MDNILKYLSYFSRKQALTLHADCLLRGENLHEMSKPVFLIIVKKKKSICYPLNLPREWSCLNAKEWYFVDLESR